MRHAFWCWIVAALAACSGSTNQDLQDAGTDSGGLYSPHTHPDDAGVHVHGDPGGSSVSHAHGLELLPDGRVLWATHHGVFVVDAADPVPTAVISGPDFHSLIADPHRPSRLWASGSWLDQGHDRWGLLESTDGGMEWVSVSHDQELIFDVLAASPSTEGFIAGVADGAVWHSHDAGRTWDSFDWPGECTGIVVVNSDVPTFLLSGAWGIIEVSAADDERITRFSGPVTDVEQWSGGTLYATAGSVIACGDDIQETSECIALIPPSTHPVRQVVHDPDRDRWYILTSGPELYLKNGDTPWQLLATGL